MTRDEISDEFLAGYLDGRHPDCPLPGPNRSAAYKHSFDIGRAERQGEPLESAEWLRQRAARIEAEMMDADDD